MTTITYATGRTYDAPQILAITVEQDATDEDGFREIVATFRDDSRHISGRCRTTLFMESSDRAIGVAILAEYDAGRYEAI
jgi:hypothetical protein